MNDRIVTMVAETLTAQNEAIVTFLTGKIKIKYKHIRGNAADVGKDGITGE